MHHRPLFQPFAFRDQLLHSARPVITVIALALAVLFPSMASAVRLPDGGGTIGPSPKGCVLEPKRWIFEEALNIRALGGFRPANGLEVLGWLFLATMAIVAVLALTMIAIGGLQYIAAAGNASRMARSRERIQNALTGLILAMASIFILYRINPELVTLRIPPLPANKAIQKDARHGVSLCDPTPDCSQFSLSQNNCSEDMIGCYARRGYHLASLVNATNPNQCEGVTCPSGQTVTDVVRVCVIPRSGLVQNMCLCQ